MYGYLFIFFHDSRLNIVMGHLLNGNHISETVAIDNFDVKINLINKIRQITQLLLYMI